MTKDKESREPQEGDYIISDSGRLGSMTSVGRVGRVNFLGEFEDEEFAEKEIAKQMHRDKFYPDVWRESDHGNYTNIGRTISRELQKIERKGKTTKKSRK